MQTILRSIAFVLGLLAAFVVQAQGLSKTQLTTLRACINAVPAWAALPNDSTNAVTIAAGLNQTAAPAWIVWRTNVTRGEIYHLTSAEGTTWNWTTYKNQGVSEQGAWEQMFMNDEANFALPNLRAGVAAIFTGSAQANAQRDHVLAVAKRSATSGEKCLSTGTGSTASPATMTFEGALTYPDVQAARSL